MKAKAEKNGRESVPSREWNRVFRGGGGGGGSVVVVVAGTLHVQCYRPV